MSIAVMSYIWDNSPAKGAELLVQLALADSANPDGVAWPSILKLASMARCTEPTVRRTLERWGESGELQVFVGGFLDGKNQSNTYRIVMGRQDLTTPPERPDVTTVGKSRYPQAGIPSPRPRKEPFVGTTNEPSPADAAGEGDKLFDVAPTEVPESELDAKVQIVWDYYFAKLGERLSLKTLSDSRKKRIKAALKAAGEDTEALCRAIDGFIRYRSSKPGSMTLDDIFSSRPGGSSLTELIEFWISQADDSPTMSAAVPAALRDRVNRRRLQIVEALKLPDDSAAQERAREAVDWLRINANEGPVIEGQQVVRWERIP